MFTLLTGRLVREGGTVNEEIALAITTPVSPLSTVMVDVAPEVATVVDKALAYDKAARWPDAQTMQAAVREARGATSAMADPATPDEGESRASLPTVSTGDRSFGPADASAPTLPSSPSYADSSGSLQIQGLPSAASRSRLRTLAAAVAAAVLLAAVVVVARGKGGGTPPAPAASLGPGREGAAPAVEPAPSVTAAESARPSVTPVESTQPSAKTAPDAATRKAPPAVKKADPFSRRE
jgi:serine/threonine-protein kinase